MSGRFTSRRLFTLILTFLWIAGNFTAVAAAGDLPPWMDALDCEQDLQAYEGLQYCTTKNDSAYVVVVDLNVESVKIEYVIAEGYDRNGYYGPCRDVNIPKYSIGPGCHASNPAYYPMMPLKQAVTRFDGAAVVINSDYGAGDQGRPGEFRGHGPEGFAVIQGNRIDGPDVKDTDHNAENRPWLAIGQSNPIQVEFGQYDYGTDEGDYADWIYTGVGGGPWLIKNGIEETNISSTCDADYDGSCYDGAEQTVVGISSNGRWLFFIIVKSTSKDMHEAIDILKSLDVKDAIKMDGGGSSQLYYAGLPGDSIERKFVLPANRQLSQYLAILAQSGNGISFDEQSDSSESSDDSDLSWWQKLQNSWSDFWTGVGDNISDRWQNIKDGWSDFWSGVGESWDNFWAEQRQKIADAWDKWWEEQQRKLAEWWKRQLVEWLNQLCGSAVLIPLTLASVWIARRKYNRL